MYAMHILNHQAHICSRTAMRYLVAFFRARTDTRQLAHLLYGDRACIHIFAGIYNTAYMLSYRIYFAFSISIQICASDSDRYKIAIIFAQCLAFSVLLHSTKNKWRLQHRNEERKREKNARSKKKTTEQQQRENKPACETNHIYVDGGAASISLSFAIRCAVYM